MKKRVTIKDVARRARVSHPTVSRVINDNPRISKKTKEKVRKAMKDLGYQPNLIARGLVRKRTRVIASIIPDLNPHVQPILRGIVDACRDRDYALMLFSTDYWTEEDLSYMWIVDNWRVDGVLIYNVLHRRRVADDIRQLQCEGSPLCFVNKYLRRKDTWTVGIDNLDAVRQALKHLASLGRKRIGIINGSMRSVDGVERNLAFKKTLSSLKLPFSERYEATANFSDDQAYEEMSRILRYKRRPDAMFCANDLMAMGAIAAIQDAHLRVPQDIAVVGMDDAESNRHFKPSLTTLRPPLRRVGELAVDLLMEIMENPRAKPRQIPVKAELIVRDSTIGKRA